MLTSGMCQEYLFPVLHWHRSGGRDDNRLIPWPSQTPLSLLCTNPPNTASARRGEQKGERNVWTWSATFTTRNTSSATVHPDAVIEFTSDSCPRVRRHDSVPPFRAKQWKRRKRRSRKSHLLTTRTTVRRSSCAYPVPSHYGGDCFVIERLFAIMADTFTHSPSTRSIRTGSTHWKDCWERSAGYWESIWDSPSFPSMK